MAVRKVGEWKRVERLVGNLAHEMKQARDKSLRVWSLKAEATAKLHISNQDLNWVPLSAAYVASKIRKDQSENILVATSDYFQAITSWVDLAKGTAYAGVKKDTKGGEGKAVWSIAAIHEYGATTPFGTIPARPLWQPTYAEVVAWFTTSKYTPTKLFQEAMKKY